MSEELSVKIKADGSNLIEEIKKVGVAVDQVNTQSKTIKIDTTAKEATNSLKELTTALSKLTGRQTVTIDSNISKGLTNSLSSIGEKLKTIKDNRKITLTLGEGSRLGSALTTLRAISSTITRLNGRSLTVDGKVYMTGASKVITDLDRIISRVEQLREIKSIKLNIETSNTAEAVSQLNNVAKALKEVNKNKNVTARVRVNQSSSSGGGNRNQNNQSGGMFSNLSSTMENLSNPSNIISYVGRMSKGFGSSLEVVGRLLFNLGNVGGAIGEAAALTAGLTAGFTVAGLAVYGVFTITQGLISLLATGGQYLYKFLEPGIELQSKMQLATLSIAAGVKGMTSLHGEALGVAQAMEVAHKITKKLTTEALKTNLSPDELATAYGGIAPLAYNKGWNPDQVIKFSSAVGNVAKMTGLASNQILQESRDLLQGTITTRTSQVANILGLTNDDIKQAQANGGDLFDFLQNKLSAYAVMAEKVPDTLPGAVQQFQEKWATATGQIIEDFTPALVPLINQVADMFGKLNETTGEFEISPEMVKFRDILIDLAIFMGSVIDSIINYAQNMTGAEDPTEAIVLLIKDMIEVTVKLTLSMITFGIGVYKACEVAYNAVSGIIAIFSALGNVIMADVNYLRAFWAAATGDKVGAEALLNKANSQFEFAGKLYREGYKTPESKDNTIMGVKGNTYNALKEALSKVGTQKSTDTGIDLKDITGNKKDSQDAAARKKMVQDSQKAMQEQIQVLKDSLADQLDVFKRAMDAIELSFKENAMSIGDYFKAKAENEQAQAQVRIDELNAERDVILKTQYTNEDDRTKALSKIDRQLSIYARTLDETNKALNEVAQMQGEYVSALQSLNSASAGRVGGASLKGATPEETALYNSFTSLKSTDITGQLTYAVLLALSQQESTGKHTWDDGKVKESFDGGVGLMQLTSPYAKGLADNGNPYDLQSNANGGTRYFIELLNQYGDLRSALVHYNGSGSAAERYADTVMQRISDLTQHADELITSATSGVEDLNSKYIVPNTTDQSVTNTTDIQPVFKNALNMLAEDFYNQTGGRVLTLTGGAEKGMHQAGEFGHEGGWKADISPESIGEFKDLFVSLAEKYKIAVGDEGNHLDLSGSQGGVGGRQLTQRTVGDVSSIGVLSTATTKLGKEAKDKLNEYLTSAMTAKQQVADIYGGGASLESLKAIMDSRKKIEQAMAQKDMETVASLRILLEEQIRGINLKNIKKNLELEMKGIQLSSEVMGYKLSLGIGDISKTVDKYTGYIYNELRPDGSKNPIKSYLDGLKNLMAEYQKEGNLQGYYDVKTAIDKVYADLANIFKNFIQRIDDLATFKTKMVENSFMTTGQKDVAKKQISTEQATSELEVQKAELRNKINQLETNLNEYGRLLDIINKSQDVNAKADASQRAGIIRQEIKDLQFKDIPLLQQAILLNEQLAKMPSLLDKVGTASRQAFEDGMNTFLTDGINNAESLSDAFNDLIVSILKSIQKVFANAITQGLMDKLFPVAIPQSKPKSSYNILNSIPQSTSVTDVSPLTTNIDFLGQNANNLSGSMTNLQQSLYQALTTIDSTMSQIISRVNSASSNISSYVSSLSSVGMPSFSSKSSGSKYTFDSNYNMLDRFASGGVITGPGTGTSDSIHALVSSGEGIVTADKVRQLGTGFIDAVNRGDFSYIRARLPKFATGGVVGETGSQASARGMVSFAEGIGTNVSTVNKMNVALVRDEQEAMEHFMNSGKGERIMLDFSRKSAGFTSRTTRK